MFDSSNRARRRSLRSAWILFEGDHGGALHKRATSGFTPRILAHHAAFRRAFATPRSRDERRRESLKMRSDRAQEGCGSIAATLSYLSAMRPPDCCRERRLSAVIHREAVPR
jgi:hypothetical protein